MYPNEQWTQTEEEIMEELWDMKQNEFQVIVDKHPDKSRIYV